MATELNLNQELFEIDGTVVKGSEGKDNINIGNVCRTALQFNGPNEKLESKTKKFDLLMKFVTVEDVVTVESNDVILLRECIGKIFSVVIVGQMLNILEGKHNILEDIKGKDDGTTGNDIDEMGETQESTEEIL